MSNTRLTSSLDELAGQSLDVLIVGSGPAGVAVAERLAHTHPDWTLGMVERGSLLTLTHINNIFPNPMRRRFIKRFKINPWEGSFRDGGMLIPALGGRGIVAGAHLRRFDPADFTLWTSGSWPADVIQLLPQYYREAEINRRVNVSAIRGGEQTWALSTLDFLHAHPPNVGVDFPSGDGFDVGHGYDSPVARLWQVLINETLNREAYRRRIWVATDSYAVRIEHNGKLAQGIRCINATDHRSRLVAARTVVITASTIESARLFLLSDLDQQLPAVGRFLAEHIERRAKIEVDPLNPEVRGQGISLVVPPENADLANRFQVHLRGQMNQDGKLEVDIGGFAAMDPCEDNRVTLAESRDEYDIPKANTSVSLSMNDQARVDNMCERIRHIARILNGKFVTTRFPFEETTKYTDASREIQEMGPGRSYHEAGTLRMGSSAEANSVTDSGGLVHGFSNLYVADAALFPCVGIANPMLTITALAYRVADHIDAFSPNPGPQPDGTAGAAPRG